MDEYAAGRTPNPCLRCNEKIKFAAVLDRALGLGFDAVATGHYAQLRTGADGLVEMHRAVDHGKDQSYVLGVLDQDQLRALAVPARRLDQGRRCARRRRRAGCWSPTSRTATTSASSPTATTPAGCARSSATGRPTTAAPIVDEATGEVLGRHDGTYGFTIGQRKGLRLGRPAPDGRAAVRARHRAGLRHGHRRPARRGSPSTGSPAIRPRWCGTVPPAALEGTVQLRAHGDEHRAVVRGRRTATVEIELLDPAYGIAPGQAAVIYDGTRVVGSATIARHPAGRLHDASATGVGSMPGDDQHAYDEACGSCSASCPTCRTCPSCRAAGRGARLTGRALAVMADLGADLQPAGWRLTDAPGRRPPAGPQPAGPGPRRARGAGPGATTGTFKVQVAGPWTLAATVEKPRGDKVLADHGARRELAQALAEGLRDHVARRTPSAARAPTGWSSRSTSRRWPPCWPAAVPTASGFDRHRDRRPARGVARRSAGCSAAIAEAGAEPWVHSLRGRDAAGPAARRRGARALGRPGHAVGAPTTTRPPRRSRRARPSRSASSRPLDPAAAPTDAQVTESVLRWLDMLGLDPDAVGDRLVLTPCLRPGRCVAGLDADGAGAAAHRRQVRAAVDRVTRPGPIGRSR